MKRQSLNRTTPVTIPNTPGQSVLAPPRLECLRAKNPGRREYALSRRVFAFISVLPARRLRVPPIRQVGLGRPNEYRISRHRALDFHRRPQERAGQIVETDHYSIHTTLSDREFLSSMAQLMEGAWKQYHLLCPDVPTSDWPMVSYLFAERSEWAAFTASRTGADAAVYLQIGRGGYTVRDWFVSYYLGDLATYSIAAHEGWHQFAARNFRTRLPPFLEEGIATLFENIRWSSGLPRWNLTSNPGRQQKLVRAIKDNQLFPLPQLMTMHAGEIVGMPSGKIEAFYAQNWAFALFLLVGDNGSHRADFQRMMADTARGTAYLKSEMPHSVFPDAWQPSSVKPPLERYLHEDLATIDRQYTEFIHHLATGSVDDFTDG